ncbi:vacuolar protein sorting-associated family 26 protein [Archangium lipolyticum]|uniref:hypothetical protein n=1 Tax=Archangium lipolyticum TaxID=2970465 RepID=UPI00214A7BB8|nr:hypothetical protein [Archangium lipolyticum]
MKWNHSIATLCCAAVLGLGPGCDVPPETSPALTFVPEYKDEPIALGLESYVDIPARVYNDGGWMTQTHDLERTTLEIQAKGGVEVLWTESMPTSLRGNTFHRIHYRCGEDASAAQRLDVKVVSQGETRYEGSYALPCEAATSFQLEAGGLRGTYVTGILLNAMPRLTAGTRQLRGRGIRQVDVDGPVMTLPVSANEFLHARTVRPGRGARFRAGPLELEVPITVVSDDQYSLQIETVDVFHDGVHVIGFSGRGIAQDGSPVWGLNGCEMTVSPASALYVQPDTRYECRLLTRPDVAAQVCMTYRGKHACATYSP